MAFTGDFIGDVVIIIGGFDEFRVILALFGDIIGTRG